MRRAGESAFDLRIGHDAKRFLTPAIPLAQLTGQSLEVWKHGVVIKAGFLEKRPQTVIQLSRDRSLIHKVRCLLFYWSFISSMNCKEAPRN
jgi:hypothetical protein